MTIEIDAMVEITGCDLDIFVRECYEMSVPVGLGFMHYRAGPLDDESLRRIVDGHEQMSFIAINMDYVRGRCVKMYVYRDQEQIFIKSRWLDHTDEQLARLLQRHGTHFQDVPLARAVTKIQEIREA